MFTTPAFAQGGDLGGGSMIVQFLPFILIFVIMYFLIIRPQRMKQKRHQEMLSGIKPGDKIVTNGGIYATVTAVGEQTVHVKIADQVKIEVAKSAVAGIQGDPDVETGK